MKWIHYGSLDGFSPYHLYNVMKLRQDIFIVEQKCIYNDLDGYDERSQHLLLITSDNTLAGYLRIVPAGMKFKECSLGRIAVKQTYRGRGLGTKLVKEGITRVNMTRSQDIRIEAQAHLENFYKDIGFVTVSDIYSVDDIPHLQMILTA